MITRREVEVLVGTKVSNLEVYTQAFTHKSALKQYPELKTSYENLEFMGDSVLGFIITRHLFDRYSGEHEEGFLTKARTKIVRGSTLAIISERLGLYRWIVMDDKGIKKGWNRNPKIMEDVLEALIGAIYLDLGIIHTKQFVFKLLEENPIDMNDDNYKDQLMRFCQNRKYELPVYTVDALVQSLFYVSVNVNGYVYGRGSGSTKKQAEQNAAFDTIKKFGLINVSTNDTSNSN
jgi:ribonuclease-3